MSDAPIQASRLVPARREAVFAFLSDLANHWRLAGRWIEVVQLEEDGRGGRVRMRGPLGLGRVATTTVRELDPPRRMEGLARLGRTRAAVRWTLDEEADGTLVRLEATVLAAGRLDRALLACGGRGWLRRRFAGTLRRLAVATEAVEVPAVLATERPATSG